MFRIGIDGLDDLVTQLKKMEYGITVDGIRYYCSLIVKDARISCDINEDVNFEVVRLTMVLVFI